MFFPLPFLCGFVCQGQGQRCNLVYAEKRGGYTARKVTFMDGFAARAKNRFITLVWPTLYSSSRTMLLGSFVPSRWCETHKLRLHGVLVSLLRRPFCFKRWCKLHPNPGFGACPSVVVSKKVPRIRIARVTLHEVFLGHDFLAHRGFCNKCRHSFTQKHKSNPRGSVDAFNRWFFKRPQQ